jgi:DNA-binding transcriptional ArsR family regulator
MQEILPVAERKRARGKQELARALSHPVRVEILQVLHGRIASPAELSREIGQRPAVVSYHASTLLKCGCLELVHTRAQQGAIENFFAVTPQSLISGS